MTRAQGFGIALTAVCGTAGAALLPDAVGILVLTLACGGALFLARKSELPLALVLGLGVLVHLPAVLKDPASSHDAYRYLWEAEVLLAGENPYRFPPDSPRLEGLRDAELHPKVHHGSIATIYPPVAQALFAVAALLGGVTSWKLLLLGLSACTAWALGRQRGSAAAVAWLWNPLLVSQAAEGGHVDGAGVTLLILALLLAERRGGGFLSWLLCGAAALIKPIPLLVAPFLLRAGWRRRPLAVAALLLAASWIPVFLLPRGTLAPRDGLLSVGGTTPPPLASFRPESRLELSHPRLGRGPAASDGRGVLLRGPDGIRGFVEASPRSRPTTTAHGAEALCGRYALGACGSRDTLLTLEFDASEHVRLVGGENPVWTPPLGYYHDDDGRFLIWQRERGETLARLELSADLQVLRGVVIDGARNSHPGLGLKGAENPFMGWSQYRGRWSGNGWLHPLFERLSGSRSGAQLLSAGLLLLAAAVLWFRRAPPVLALGILASLAIACLPVTYPWYWLWLLPALVLSPRPETALLLSPLALLSTG